MLAHDLTTVDLVHREDATTFHARNPFPVGGVVGPERAGGGGGIDDSLLTIVQQQYPLVDRRLLRRAASRIEAPLCTIA